MKKKTKKKLNKLVPVMLAGLLAMGFFGSGFFCSCILRPAELVNQLVPPQIHFQGKCFLRATIPGKIIETYPLGAIIQFKTGDKGFRSYATLESGYVEKDCRVMDKDVETYK